MNLKINGNNYLENSKINYDIEYNIFELDNISFVECTKIPKVNSK